MATARQVRITGRVQGVGFRAWTETQAQRHGISGWVRNEPDGSVAALIAGAPDDVEAMLAALQEGPRGSAVSEVAAEPAEPPERSDFQIVG